MAGYPANQDGIYISPDVHIPPGMTAYPMQPPGIPHQQQQRQLSAPLPQPAYPTIQPHHAPVYFMPPPVQPPSQYNRHPAGPQISYPQYPPPPLPRQQHHQQQHSQFNRNDGSTTVMLPVTFTPGMAPIIHHSSSGGVPTTNSRQQQIPGSQVYFPPHSSQQFSGNAAAGASGGVSPRYLSIGPRPLLPQLPPPPGLQPPPPHHQQQQQMQTHNHQYHQFPSSAAGFPSSAYPPAASAAAVQMWPGSGTAAVLPRMSPPPAHPLTHSGQDFQAAMPSGVTGPLHPLPPLPPRPPQAAGVAAAGGARLSVEQSADSTPHSSLIARKRAQPHNSHGYKSQNDDLIEQGVPAAAGVGPSADELLKAQTAAAQALDTLAEAAAASVPVPEASRASRSSARQQHMKTMKQNEVQVAAASGSGTRGTGKKGDKPGIGKTTGVRGNNTSDALRKELGAALLASDTSARETYPRQPVTAASEMMPPPQPQQSQQPQQQQVAMPPHQVQQSAVPSSVLQNLSRALADLSRMTAGNPAATPATTTITTPRAAVAAPMPTTSVLYPPRPTATQLPHSQPSHGHPAPSSAPVQYPRSFPPGPAHSIPSSVPYFPRQQQHHHVPPLPMQMPPLHRPHPPNATAPVLPAPRATLNPVEQRPPTGPRVSRPLQLENPCFGPGVSFPRQLKRKRSNMIQSAAGKYSQKKKGAAGGGANSNNNMQQQAQKLMQQGYYVPSTSARPNLHSNRPPPLPQAQFVASQQQQPLPMNRGAAPIALPANHTQHQASFPSAPATDGRLRNINQGQMMQPQQKAGSIMPSSLQIPGVSKARASFEAQQELLPSPQPAPNRLQRSSVATTRAEPMVRIVRDISSASQLQRLQVDSKMERSLLLPPVPPPLLPIATTTAQPKTRGALLAEKSSAAVAVALAVNASPSLIKKKVAPSPKKPTTSAAVNDADNNQSDAIIYSHSHSRYQQQQQHYPDEFTPLFKMNLTIIDESDQAWPVTYEGLACSGQRHVRLSSGWHAMMKGLGVLPGDKVVLERWTEDKTVLHLLVLEGSEEQRATAAAAGAVKSGGNVEALLPSPPPLQEEGTDTAVRNTTRNRKNSKVVHIKTSSEAPSSKRTRR